MVHIRWQEKDGHWTGEQVPGSMQVLGLLQVLLHPEEDPTGVLLLLLKDLTLIIRSSARGLPTSEPGGPAASGEPLCLSLGLLLPPPHSPGFLHTLSVSCEALLSRRSETTQRVRYKYIWRMLGKPLVRKVHVQTEFCQIAFQDSRFGPFSAFRQNIKTAVSP